MALLFSSLTQGLEKMSCISLAQPAPSPIMLMTASVLWVALLVPAGPLHPFLTLLVLAGILVTPLCLSAHLPHLFTTVLAV